MPNLPKVAIIYLSYHSEPYLHEMVDSIEKLTYPKDKMVLLMVDNPHPEHGSSVARINDWVVPFSKTRLPEVVVLPQEKNTGFAGGNNVGIKWAIEHGFDYVFLHNQDGFVEPECISKLVEAMESDKKIGCAQSLVMLHGEGDRVNTAGNTFNYLGFGFIDHFGKKKNELNLAPIQTVGYASGCALMMSTELIKKYGPLDEDFFAYHEDVEYSLRLKLAGYKVVCVKDSVFNHKYVFNRSSSKFYLMERNRYGLLLMYYRWPTLLLLLPILVIMEIGLLCLFLAKGWAKEKGKMYAYWLKPANWMLFLGKRKVIQKLRVISDRKMIKDSVGYVYFGEKKDMNHPLLLYVANPLMKVYRSLISLVIFW